MKNPIKILNKKDLVRRFSQVHRKNIQNLLKDIPFATNDNIYDITSRKERLFFLRTREIIDELTQIMICTQKIGEFGYDNSIIFEQIQSIQSRLRSIDGDYKYTQIINILTKYLSGIRRFSIATHMSGILFYKQLFEGTFMAITREIDYLEESIY